MDRILLVAGAMMAVGLALVGFWVVISYHGGTFETIEDNVVRWIGRS